MSHSPTIKMMDSYADKSITAKDPLVFLNEFAPMHEWWHKSGRIPGFLLFHWHAIRNLKHSNGESIWPSALKPFSLNEWKKMDWEYKLSIEVTEGDIDSFARFSRELESWHNQAHMAVGMATGQDLMNPLTNIYLRNFWRLHYFIDKEFIKALDKFNTSAASTSKKIIKLEHDHHGRIREI